MIEPLLFSSFLIWNGKLVSRKKALVIAVLFPLIFPAVTIVMWLFMGLVISLGTFIVYGEFSFISIDTSIFTTGAHLRVGLLLLIAEIASVICFLVQRERLAQRENHE